MKNLVPIVPIYSASIAGISDMNGMQALPVAGIPLNVISNRGFGDLSGTSIVIPEPGMYEISFKQLLRATTCNFYLNAKVNGHPMNHAYGTIHTQRDLVCGGMVRLQRGDLIQFGIYTTDGGSHRLESWGGGHSHWSLKFVHE